MVRKLRKDQIRIWTGVKTREPCLRVEAGLVSDHEKLIHSVADTAPDLGSINLFVGVERTGFLQQHVSCLRIGRIGNAAVVYGAYRGALGLVKMSDALSAAVMERRNYLVDLGKTEAILPIQEQIPRETYRRGDRVKAMLLEVRRTPKDVQVILTRSHPQFVSKLFELEVPEVMEKIVEIKAVVREPGDRTKIAVTSREKAVDPVGACVGIKGSRVQAVVRELRGEKIDIITWTSDPRVFIAEALNPATIEKVGVDEEKKSALVVVADSQLSLAIGKNGQNVRLAARLTGWKIDIISATEYEKEKAERDKEIKAALAEEAEAQRQQEEARQQEKAQQEAEG